VILAHSAHERILLQKLRDSYMF